MIIANGQKLKIVGQVLISIEVGHIKKYSLLRLVPRLRSTEILRTDVIERLGLKLDFEKKMWWLPQKSQIEYKKESNPKENMVKCNREEEKDEETSIGIQDRRRIFGRLTCKLDTRGSGGFTIDRSIDGYLNQPPKIFYYK